MELSKTFLERTHEITCGIADSAEEALEKLAADPYDAVVSDYEMPGISGIELLKRIRESGSDLPFIVYTAKGREHVAVEALNLGADFYLQKTSSDVRSEYAELENMVKKAIRIRTSEREVREKEQRFRKFFNEIRDGVSIGRAIFDKDGNPLDIWITDVNPAFTKLTGITAEEARAKPVTELYRGMDPGMIDLICHVAKTGESQIVDWYVPPLGRHFRNTAYGIEPGMFATIFSDVTGADELSEQIRRQDQLLHRVLDKIPILTVTINLMSGSVRPLNQHLPDVLGYQIDEVPDGLPGVVEHLLHPDDIGRVGEIIADLQQLRDGESKLVELRMLHKDGSYRRMAFDLSVYARNADWTVREVIALLWDATEGTCSWSEWLQRGKGPE